MKEWAVHGVSTFSRKLEREGDDAEREARETCDEDGAGVGIETVRGVRESWGRLDQK